MKRLPHRAPRSPARWRRTGWRWLLAGALASAGTHAQIRTDGSLGQPALTLSGPNYAITQALGRVAGNNLFHSFQTFNLAAGEAANFSTSSPNISNVISRVTGGEMSRINGTVRLSAAGGNPAFFFINPAGVTFGAGASVDVPGAFHASTANYLKFPDGKLYADTSNASTFSSAEPAAYGFLGTTRATVTIKDGALLKPRATYPISVVAGDIALDAGGFGAAAGDVRAVAVGSGSADVALSGSLPPVDGNLLAGNGGFIASTNLGAIPAGQILVRAGNIALDAGGHLASDSRPGEAGGAGRIDVAATRDLSLGAGGYIQSLTGSSGDGAEIRIQAQRINIDREGYVYSAALDGSTGNAARIRLSARDDLTIGHGASVSSATFATGNAGDIALDARNISVAGTGYVASDTFAASTGNTGSLTLTASERIALSEQGKVYVSTTASGGAGNIDLRAGDIALGTDTYVASIVLAGSANAGRVDLRADRALSLSGNAGVFSISSSTGDAGVVRIEARDITLDTNSKVASTAALGSGNAGSVEVIAGASLSLRNGSLIDSSTHSAGRAGSIKVNAHDISVDQDSLISSIALAGSGDAGNIEIASAGQLTLSNGGAILSSTFTTGAAGSIQIAGNDISLRSGGHLSTATNDDAGNGGNIRIRASGLLSVKDGFLSASTFTAGRAGSIDISAAAIALDGPASRIDAIASVGSSGQTGNIALRAADSIRVSGGATIAMFNLATPARTDGLTPSTLSLAAPGITLDHGSITAVSDGNLAAGNIDIQFTKTLALTASRITTSANLGNGGQIGINGGTLLSLNQSKINTSVIGAAGNGGDIRIRADALLLNTGFIQANTAASQASGGLVDIGVGTLLASGSILFVGGQSPLDFAPGIFGFNVIQAAAPTGVSGTIQITSPLLDLSGSLGRLSAQVMDAAGLGRDPCRAAGGSSLAQAGRGGLPLSHRGLLRAEAEQALPAPGASAGMPAALAGLSPRCR